MCEQATREVAPIQVFLTNLTNIDTCCVLLCLLACISEANNDRCKRSSWPKIGKCVFVSSAYWFYFRCAIFVGHYSKDKCFWVVGELVLMYSPCTLSNKEDVCLYLCAFLSILLALPVNQWRGQSEHTIAPCWPITESLNVFEQYFIPNDTAFHP